MKKNLFSLALIVGLATISNAQVGVNTDTPASTLDVSVKRNGTTLDNSQTYGLQAPRLTRTELTNITATYGQNQRGALIYVTDISGGNATGQRINVTAIGYYYFDGTVWQALKGSMSSQTEPWRVATTTNEATLNTQDIYQDASIGIGDFSTSAPQAALHIRGTGDSSDNIIQESIGTTSNDAALFLQRARGTAAVKAAVVKGDAVGTYHFQAHDGSSYLQRAFIRGFVNNNSTSTVSTGNVPTDIAFFTGSSSAASERMRILYDGKVGIGTSAPNQTLEVNGYIKSKALTNGNDAFTTSDFGLYNTTNTWMRLAVRGSDNEDSGSSKITFFTNASQANPIGNGSTPAMLIAGGKVGVNVSAYGTNEPGNKLEVKHGTAGNSGLRLTDLKNATYLATDANGDVISTTLPDSSKAWNESGKDTFATSATQNIYQNGFIGIKTRVPERAIHITGDGGATDDILVVSNSDSPSSTSQLNFRKSRGSATTPTPVEDGDRIADILFTPRGTTYQETASIRGVVNGTVSGNTIPTDILFLTGSNSTVTERMRILSSGNIGIGTGDPKQKLDVNGMIKATALTNSSTLISTSDFGLYNATNNWLRIATRGADNGASGTSKIAFYTNASEASPTGSGNVPAMFIANGKVGINVDASTTNQPGAKLHVKADNSYEAIQIQDGSQGQGKFLASDANGKATWVTSPLTAISQGSNDTSAIGANVNYPVDEDMYLYKKINLTKGRWMVNVGQLFNAVGASDANNQWVRLILSSSESSNEVSGFSFLGSRLVSGWLSTVGTSTEQYTFISGVIPVEVTANNVTLYLRTREFVKKGTVDLKSRTSFQENYLFAIPAY